MKRSFVCAIMILICMLAAGCGRRGERTAQLEDYGSSDSMREEQMLAGYVSGSWGEKFVRSNGYTYPYVFDEVISQCTGFTLDYQIMEVEGDLSGNFRYEVYVRQTGGKWKSVKLFQLDGDAISVEVQFGKPMDIDAVAVVCGKKGDASFSYTIGVRDVKNT